MGKPINFLERFDELGLNVGDLYAYPVDDTAICAYGITEDEIAPYMIPKYRGRHWSDVLDLILEDRKKAAK